MQPTAPEAPEGQAPQIVAVPDIANPDTPAEALEATRHEIEAPDNATEQIDYDALSQPATAEAVTAANNAEPTTSRIDATPVPEEAKLTLEAPLDREAILAKLDVTQQALNDLRATFEGVTAEDPLKNSLPVETVAVEPEVAEEASQIITRGQVPVAPQPTVAEQPTPDPIEVPEDLQAHPQPNLQIVRDPITSNDIPGEVPVTGEPVAAPTKIIDGSDIPQAQAPVPPAEPTGDSNEHSFIRSAGEPAPAETPGDPGNV